MKKNIVFIACLIALLFMGVFVGYILDNDGSLNENDLKNIGMEPVVKSKVTVYSEGPVELDKLIKEIKTKPYFEGYNSDTLSWMESLDQKNVFLSNDSYVIMDNFDANKVNTVYVTDAYIEEYLDCVVIENRSLGGNNSYDILLVKDVTNLGNYTYYYDV